MNPKTGTGDNRTTQPSPASQLAWQMAEARRRILANDKSRLLYLKLSSFRTRIAKESGIPPFRVLTVTQMMQLCEAPPACTEDLARIPGFGPFMVRAFGAELLSVVGQEGAR